MKKYDSYKDSGIEWIGEIPSHWSVNKVKHNFSFKTGFTPPSGKSEYYEDGTHVWINISDLQEKEISDSVNKITDKAIEDFKPEIVQKGSLLYSFKLSVGRVGFNTMDCYTNEAIFSINPDSSTNLNFFYYSLPDQILKNANENIYGAKILNQELIKNAYLVIPPTTEQTAIASFLDRKTSELDEIIADKKRLLELYEEEKTAIINQAVTKGLDPNAPMKDSGIEWIGEIPEHWEVSRIKYYLDYQKGKNPKEINFDKGSTSEIYLAMDFLRGEPRQILYVDDTDGYVKVDENEILLLWDGSNAGEFILSKRGILSSTMAVIYLNNIKKRYSWYYLKNFEPRLKENTIGMGIPHVNGEELKNGYITIPPKSEQTSIASFLDRKTSEIDFKKARTEELIELLTEYRAALISEAVTGKIKVTED